jgi:hypothetical protein
LFHSEAIANGGDSIKFQIEHRLRVGVPPVPIEIGLGRKLPQAEAGNLATNPNAAQIVQQFVYKRKPTELLLKPQEKPKPNKPAKDAKD